VLGEAHVGNDLRLEQADGVAGDRVAEARVELLGHRGAADHVAALEQAHLEPGAGEVERADRAVVAGADDEGVVLLGHITFRPAPSSSSRTCFGTHLSAGETWAGREMGPETSSG
jgi:hypothetical protein